MVQEVQANNGSRIDTMTQQTQGLSDNVQDVQSRVGKLSQQMTDMQNLLQSIDAKVSAARPRPLALPELRRARLTQVLPARRRLPAALTR